MKQVILLVGTILVATGSFAYIQSTSIQSSPNNSASRQHVALAENESGKHLVRMVYAGEDISRKPTLNPQTVIV